MELLLSLKLLLGTLAGHPHQELRYGFNHATRTGAYLQLAMT